MTDHRHLSLVKAPAADTFESWYRAHRAQLRAMCARMIRDDALAEDIAQEALLRAWSRRSQFAAGADIGPWLRTVARNLAIEALRARGRVVPSSDALPDHPDQDSDPVLPLELADEHRAVRDALATMSERHRALLVARDIEGVEYTELASREGLSEDATRAVLFRARRILRDRYLAVSQAIGAFVLWLRTRARSVSDRAALPAVHSVAAAIMPALGLTVALTLGAGTGSSPALRAPAAVPSGSVRAAAQAEAHTEAGAGTQEDAHQQGSSGVAGVRASLDRKSGSGHVRARAKNPVTGEDEYVWTRVWREQGQDDSEVLSAADEAADTACGESPETCDAVDDILEDPPGVSL